MSESEKEISSQPQEHAESKTAEGAFAHQDSSAYQGSLGEKGSVSNPENSRESGLLQEEHPTKQHFSPIIPLHPLNFGEIFGGVFAVFRRYFAVVFGISALVALVVQGSNYLVNQFTTPISLPSKTAETSTEVIRQLQQQLSALSGTDILIAAADFLMSVAADAFLAGFLIILVGKAVLGRAVTFPEVFAELKSRFVPLVFLTLLYNVVKIIGLICFVLPGIWVSVAFMFATSVLMLERSRIGEAFARSYALMAGAWLRNFGVLLVSGFGYLLVDLVLHSAFRLNSGALLESFSTLSTAGEDRLLLHVAVDFLTNAIAAPFLVCAVTIAYLDQRMRKEDLAVELKRAVDSRFPR